MMEILNVGNRVHVIIFANAYYTSP